jgi:hypothetical protein
MSTTTLELTNNIETNTNVNKTSSTRITSPSNLDSSEDDYIDRDIIHRNQKSLSSKLILFGKRYKKILQLVFKSVIPDLKSFKCWQVIILLLFAAFNVVFSVLVSYIISIFKLFIFLDQRILILFSRKNQNVLY